MRYVRGLAEAAQRRGAVLHGSSPVIEWRRDGERHLLVTPRGTVRARQVVIATNGYTNDSLNPGTDGRRSEEHTSELQSLMRTSYAVFCLQKKKTPRAKYT